MYFNEFDCADNVLRRWYVCILCNDDWLFLKQLNDLYCNEFKQSNMNESHWSFND